MPMKVVDFHTHILPAIDDGSSSVEESIALLKEEKEQGIDVVVVTPHFYPQNDRPERFLQRRKAAFEQLMEKISPDDKLPQIILG
ncbi:MAG: capsular polysaccharide biosynthesis protein, partial [Oscillospiraceae bacterium]|nr:capsular polysaccharide biosynthesis protein [Oscillospiraceae bacterium]